MIITCHRRYSSVYDMCMTDTREVVEWIHGCELWHGQAIGTTVQQSHTLIEIQVHGRY